LREVGGAHSHPSCRDSDGNIGVHPKIDNNRFDSELDRRPEKDIGVGGKLGRASTASVLCYWLLLFMVSLSATWLMMRWRRMI
jgi:hypothetical protein